MEKEEMSFLERRVASVPLPELHHQIEYAKRQFEVFKARVLLNQALNKPEVMKAYIQHMEETRTQTSRGKQ